MTTNLMTTAQLDEARAWIADCVWGDLDEDAIDALTDTQVTNGIRRHYSGGIAGFIADAAL